MGTRTPLLVPVLFVIAACGDATDPADGRVAATVAEVDTTEPDVIESSTTEPDAIEPDATEPDVTEPDTTEPDTIEPVDEWTPLLLDGCVCSDGSVPTFFERAGDPTEVVLYFEGGGACFSKETCDPNGDPTYAVTADATADGLAARGGYFDLTRSDNPLADHSWVYVPYCTGDGHLGNATTDYGDGVVIEHRGYVNGSAALEHLLARYPDVEQLVVTGASAGSIPTPLFAALAADRLPGADVVTFGDSSAAYPDVDPVNEAIGTLWGTTDAIPDWPETAGLTAADWSIPELYVYSGRHAPSVRFGRFDYAYDTVQATFGALAGVAADELVTLIDETEDQIEAAGPQIATYVAPGTAHTIVGDDLFYTLEVEGVRLVDWFTELIAGGTPADVRCTDCS
ncbi:MAG: hypothetical protein RLZZ01_2647 [Actinomycetota bacterium]